jgi:hypothetical protein
MTTDPTTTNLKGTSRKASRLYSKHKKDLYINKETFMVLIQRKYPMSGLFPYDVMKNKMTLTEAATIDLISHNESHLSNIHLHAYL